jgi:hypothetical protein
MKVRVITLPVYAAELKAEYNTPKFKKVVK